MQECVTCGQNAARGKESKCGDEDHLFFSAEINNFKATFIINLSNITCVDQFFYGDQFESIVSLLQVLSPKESSPPLLNVHKL